MKLRFKLGHIWVLCLVFGLLTGVCAHGAPHNKERKTDQLAKAYRAARTEFERRAVCLDAIDAGVIKRGRGVAVVDAIFGTNYAKKLPSGSEPEGGIVYFQPQLQSPRNDVQQAFVGWYLAFKFDSNGTLQDYYLSNLHK